MTLDQLVRFASISEAGGELLKIIGRVRCNVLVSGGTGSGKTTLLNCLTNYIDGDERVITCEDAAELQLQQPHVVRLETRPPNLEGEGAITMRDLVKNCLRMRPERIIVGEVRGQWRHPLDIASLKRLLQCPRRCRETVGTNDACSGDHRVGDPFGRQHIAFAQRRLQAVGVVAAGGEKSFEDSLVQFLATQATMQAELPGHRCVDVVSGL